MTRKRPAEPLKESIESDSGESDALSSLGSLESESEAASSDWDASSDEDDALVESGSETENTRKAAVPVTKQMLDGWEKLLSEQFALRTAREMLMAYRAAVASVAAPEAKHAKKKKALAKEPEVAFKYSVENGAVFSRLVASASVQIPAVVAHHFALRTPMRPDALEAATRNSSFLKIRSLLYGFLQTTVALLRAHVDAGLLTHVLKQAASFSKYFCLFPGLCKRFLREVLDLFATHAAAETRVAAFLALRHVASAAPRVFMEKVQRASYLTFLRHCGTTNAQTWPAVSMMMDCIVELLDSDTTAAYQVGFVYIRQLALQLRGAMQTKTPAAQQQVYSWPFLNALRLWARFLVSRCAVDSQLRRSEKHLDMLVYPLVQVALGAVQLLPTARHLPFRFHVVQILAELADATQLYIPLTTALIDVLGMAEIRSKGRRCSLKPLDWTFSLTTGQMYLGTAVFRDGALEQLHFLLLTCVARLSAKVYFPELALPISGSLRRAVAVKHGLAPHRHGRLFQSLLQSIDATVTAVSAHRDAHASDLAPVSFEKLGTAGDLPRLRWQETPLGRSYASAAAVRATLEAAAASAGAPSGSSKDSAAVSKAKRVKGFGGRHGRNQNGVRKPKVRA